jgi:tetratricopeptide (TPR) repeat protein
MASGYHQLGMLAQDRGDYDEAARQYQRSLDIEERLGNQAGMASSYSQLGILERERGGPASTAIKWNVQALRIRLRLRVPQAGIDLRQIATYRRELDAEVFDMLLGEAAGDTELAGMIRSLLDETDKAEGGIT